MPNLTAKHKRRGKLRYSILLAVKHPSLDPGSITSILGYRPLSSWRAGEPKKTPKGTIIPGHYDRSGWNCVFEFKGGERFFESAEALIQELAKHEAFLAELTQSGSVDLHIHLPGDVGLGDALSRQALKLLVAHNVGVSVEVFPDWD